MSELGEKCGYGLLYSLFSGYGHHVKDQFGSKWDQLHIKRAGRTWQVIFQLGEAGQGIKAILANDFFMAWGESHLMADFVGRPLVAWMDEGHKIDSPSKIGFFNERKVVPGDDPSG